MLYISRLRYGLDAIYLQAKRWQGSIGHPNNQKPLGALQGEGACKVVLIDGDKLVDLMYDYGIGTTVMQTINLKRFDTDYFED